MPILGAIAVFKDNGKGPYGHVAFVAGQTEKGEIGYLGGNQGNSVSYHIGSWEGKYLVGYYFPIGYFPWPNNLPIINSRSINKINMNTR